MQKSTFTLLALMFTCFAPYGYAATYWGNGIQENRPIEVCFVGDALDPSNTAGNSNADLVIQSIREEYENAANIRFLDLGTCPPSTGSTEDSFRGDIRVRVANSNVAVAPGSNVPGNGCMLTEPDPPKNWSDNPSNLSANRSCLYNISIQFNFHKKMVLHEFGHALGLAHEHKRQDADKPCSAPGYRGSLDFYMTPYDTFSVMHYRFDTCLELVGGMGTAGDNASLTKFDRLAFHIIYPEDNRVAEFTGTTAVPVQSPFRLRQLWDAQGAISSKMIKSILWRAENLTESRTIFTGQFSAPGKYPFTLEYTDFRDVDYTYEGTIEVLSAYDFKKRVAAVSTAVNLLLF